jgi:hypothetical protein
MLIVIMVWWIIKIIKRIIIIIKIIYRNNLIEGINSILKKVKNIQSREKVDKIRLMVYNKNFSQFKVS